MPKSKEIVSSSGSSSDSEAEVSSKKRKKETKEKAPPKKSKKEEKSDDEENSWELGQNRFVEVKEFKGKIYVDIREKYTDAKTQELKPGKKGIFLTVPQWKKMVELADEVNEAVSKM